VSNSTEEGVRLTSRIQPAPGLPGMYTAPADRDMAGGPNLVQHFSFDYPILGIEDNGESCAICYHGYTMYLGVKVAEVTEAWIAHLKAKNGSGEELHDLDVTGLEDM
jgi:hypothetical protein